MLKRKSSLGPVELSGEAFGVGLTLTASDPKLMAMLCEWLPPAWREGETGVSPLSLGVRRLDKESYELERDGAVLGVGPLEETIRTFELRLRSHIAASAPAHMFIHAGTVAHDGRAIVIPGPSFSGKTTLVGALVAAGAAYYSDEYAVIDGDGQIHPFPKPISIRSETSAGARTNHHPSSLGATIGTEPVPIGLVVCTQYRSDASWEPERLTPAEAALELLACSYHHEGRSREALATLGRAILGVSALKGDRGDAVELAPELLRSADHALRSTAPGR